jgi:hypothetical protein
LVLPGSQPFLGRQGCSCSSVGESRRSSPPDLQVKSRCAETNRNRSLRGLTERRAILGKLIADHRCRTANTAGSIADVIGIAAGSARLRMTLNGHRPASAEFRKVLELLTAVALLPSRAPGPLPSSQTARQWPGARSGKREKPGD